MKSNKHDIYRKQQLTEAVSPKGETVMINANTGSRGRNEVKQAAVIARVGVRDINRGVEAGVVHFLGTTEGSLLVCMSSLG